MNETIISRHVHNNIMRVTGILDISEAVMNGEVEYQKEILIKYLCLYSCRVWLQLKVWRAMMPSRYGLGALHASWTIKAELLKWNCVSRGLKVVQEQHVVIGGPFPSIEAAAKIRRSQCYLWFIWQNKCSHWCKHSSILLMCNKICFH